MVRAGLWEKEVRLSQFDKIDFKEIYRLAEEQSVVGLVAAGLEHVVDIKIPQEIAILFASSAMQLEQRNEAMNSFIESLYGRMRQMGIYSILVKGQGIALCYERPLWRASGDVDLLLNHRYYDKAKEWLLASGKVELEENYYKKRIEFSVEGWDVELHGTMRGELGRKIDKVIDDVQKDIFYGGGVRSNMFGKTSVFMPAPDNDVIFIFTHILQHFFRGGIGLRQICDWCRLLWTFREVIDTDLLHKRLTEMRIMTEWYAFAALAVDWLGMPKDSIPLYSPIKVWKRNAKRIMNYVLMVGNFGHNKDRSYLNKHTIVVRKMISFCRHFKDFFPLAMIFPVDTLKTSFSYLVRGTEQMVRENKG